MSSVSIIIPNYNHAKYLPQRLESVYNQTYQDFEVILLDDFSNDDNIQNWIYTLSAEPSSFQYRNKRYENVIAVMQIDEAVNVPITIPTAYAFRNYAVDRFAKNIGLVYREWESWEYQPNTGGSGGPYRIGFGIRQWMVEYN